MGKRLTRLKENLKSNLREWKQRRATEKEFIQESKLRAKKAENTAFAEELIIQGRKKGRARARGEGYGGSIGKIGSGLASMAKEFESDFLIDQGFKSNFSSTPTRKRKNRTKRTIVIGGKRYTLTSSKKNRKKKKNRSRNSNSTTDLIGL